MVGKRRTTICTRSKDARKISGPPAPLDKTEPPIFRQVIQYSYFLLNTHPDLTEADISKIIAKDIIGIWKAVNPRLPLINEKSIVNKVKIICFQKAKQINRKSLSAFQEKLFQEKLDTLFDIASCTCKLPILSCDDKNVKCNKEHCQTKHIHCTCPLEKKVPVEEREYLKDQRAKNGPKGTFQLGPIDKADIKKCKRKTERLEQQKRLCSSSNDASTYDDENAVLPLSSSPNSDSTEVEYFEPERNPTGPYSLIKIPRYTMELIRGDISSNLGASLANALILDLEAMGLLKSNVDIKDIIVDKCKIDRQKARMKENAHQRHGEILDNLVCIGVDGRNDKNTLLYKEILGPNGEKILKKAKGPERHLTFTTEMEHKSEYLTHRVIPNIGATSNVLAEEVVAVLKEYNSESTIKAILVDNTNANTGCEAGLVVLVEKKLQTKIHTIGCSLHQNELPFRALFKHIDGITKSPTTFAGPLGKLCCNDYNHLPQVRFTPVGCPLDICFTAEEINELTSDQRLLFEYALGICRGKVDPKFAAWKIGPIHQARWLTLSIRLMCLWTRGAYPQEMSGKLHSLIKFIVEVYAVSWFEIKRDNKFHNQQLYIFNMINRIKKQPPEIQHITLKNLQHNAFALLPENILYAMVKSDELEVREEAIKKILSIRKEEPAKKRLKKITQINFNANHWSELIDLSQSGVCEPAFTETFSEDELLNSLMNGIKLKLPDLPSHSQTVERAVKLTTEASEAVYGFEARHRHILAKVLCRQMRPAFASKGSYVQQFDAIC